MLGFQGGVSIPLVKGGVKAPPAKRQCRAGPKAGARRGFTRWAMALGSHKEAEYTYVLPRVPDLPPARYNAGGHQALLAGLEDLQRCLHEELGRTIVIPRTQRQLIGKVIALLIAQADLLEEEEERLLPLLRHHLGETEQLEMARRLLFDPESEDEHWMLDWVAQHLTEAERHALAALVSRFAPVPPAWPRAPLDASAPHGAAQSSTADGETAMTASRTSGASPIDVMYLPPQSVARRGLAHRQHRR